MSFSFSFFFTGFCVAIEFWLDPVLIGVFSRFIPVILFFAKLVFVLCFVDRGLCIGLPAAGDSVGIDSKPTEAHARLMTQWFFRQQSHPLG